MLERIEADYLIETALDPRKAAEVMAGEQSSGTFIAVPGETPELKERSAARVEKLEIIGEVPSPSLPGGKRAKDNPHGPIQQAHVTLSWPAANVNASLPNLLATLAGNLFELGEFSGLRLLDMRLTADFAKAYQGPKFGIAGTRKFANAPKGPLIGTIIKPSIGLSPGETAALVDRLCAAGIDFIKDDELQGDASHCPFDDRVRAVMKTINRHADKTGKKAMYAFNLTGDLDQMRKRHDLVLQEGGTCIMASINSVGLTGMIELARHTALTLHAHRNGWGYLTRAPALGFDYMAWQKIWRLAGVDHMHVNGIGNKFSESDESVVRSARAVAQPLFKDKPCIIMPVFSSGQTVLQARATFEAVGGDDLIYAAGGGVMAHPGGPEAGVRSLREAWEAAMAGVAIETHARTHPALQQALGTFK
ncbi:ribulose-bisphosphate carboxylase large subunit family protein [Aestuariivirga sp.]|uniref:ribulose-bisphosphate carboxylase large subunit family protein n=1 Tax=Aestuariivirga sp. TaxID=2650926 RepID=UPI0039E37E36